MKDSLILNIDNHMDGPIKDPVKLVIVRVYHAWYLRRLLLVCPKANMWLFASARQYNF